MLAAAEVDVWLLGPGFWAYKHNLFGYGWATRLLQIVGRALVNFGWVRVSRKI